MGITKNREPAWGWVGEYHFESIREGTVWTVARRDQADSIRVSFLKWAERRGIEMRAKTWTDMEDGVNVIRIKFSASITKRRRR